MKFPKLGQKIYGVQKPVGRLGETMFLCSTQENAEKSFKKALKEGDFMIEETVGLCPGEDFPETIIWEMKRVR